MLAGRPLLDIGTGDGQTILALTTSDGLRVGVDRSSGALRAARRSGLTRGVASSASELAFKAGAFGTVVAADVFHHTDDAELALVVSEIRRVVRGDGRLIAWWYERPGRGGQGDPRFPRLYEEVAAIVAHAGFADVAPLALEFGLEPSPPTVGLLAAG